MRKVLAFLLSTLMIITMPMTVLASEFSDMPNDWSTVALKSAVAEGLFIGTNGQIRPKDNLTRAQMAAVINRAFGTTQKASLEGYTDVAKSAWYYEDMARAVHMKTFVGSGNRLNPDKYITREEAFVVLARAFQLSGGTANVLNKFTDKHEISSWAKEDLAAMVASGYIAGSNGKLNPKQNITRAQFAQMMHNLLQNYIKTPGIYTAVLDGNVMISSPDVILKNLTVKGDLILGDGVGEGDVTLDGVKVTGRIVVRGGGINSIKIIGNSEVGTLIISKVDGNVRVMTADGTIVEAIYIDDGKDDIILEGEIGNIEIAVSDVNVMIQNAKVQNITVTAPNTNINIDKDTTVDSVNVSQAAQGTALSVGGTVTTVNANATGTLISGVGIVINASILGDNSQVNTIGTKIEVGNNVSGTTSNGQSVTGGTMGTTTSSGEVTGISKESENSQSDEIDDRDGGSSKVAVSAITVTPTTMTLTSGGTTATITARVAPENATNKNVTWSSSNTNVATVEGGVVTPLDNGIANIIATSVDGSKTAMVVVTVEEVISVKNYTLILVGEGLISNPETREIEENTSVTVTVIPPPNKKIATFNVGGVNRKSELLSDEYTFVITKDTIVEVTYEDNLEIVTFVDFENSKIAGEYFDISGAIYDFKDISGNIVNGGEYIVEVRSNEDGIVLNPTVVEFVYGRPAVGIDIQLTTAKEHILTVKVGEARDTANVTVVAAEANKYAFITAMDSVIAGEQANFTVQLQDEYGNPILNHTGFTTTFTIESIINPEEVIMEPYEGETDFTWTYNYVGTYTIKAESNGILPAEHNITVVPSEVTSITIAWDNLDYLIAGDEISFYVEAQDEYDNRVNLDPNAFTWTNATNGVFNKTQQGTYDVVAEYYEISSEVITVEVIPGDPAVMDIDIDIATKIAKVGETYDLLGSIYNLKDAYGNIVANDQYNVNVKGNIAGEEITLFSGPVSFEDGVSVIGGNTNFIDIRLIKAGEHTLTIEVVNIYENIVVNLAPEIASRFNFPEHSYNMKAGNQVTIRVEVIDEYGNLTTKHDGFNNFITVFDGKGTLNPAEVNIGDNESYVDFTWTHTLMGTYFINTDSDVIYSDGVNITVFPTEDVSELIVEPLNQQGILEPINIVMNGLKDIYGNLQTGDFYLEISSDRVINNIFEGAVAFTGGALTQEIILIDPGTHVLSIRVNGVELHNVTVETLIYEVEGVNLEQDSFIMRLEEGQVQLSATITPHNATFPQVTWSSSNPAIASVNANGLLSGIGVGTALITVTNDDSGLSDTITVQIESDIIGSGTRDNPFIVYTFKGLEMIGTGKYILKREPYGVIYYSLGADIDASPTQSPDYNDGKGWKPINGTSLYFDGQGFKISNLKINRPTEKYIGLFGKTAGGYIQNIRLDNIYIAGDEYVGGLVGRAERTTIRKCYIQGTVIGNFIVGGMVGSAYGQFGSGHANIEESFASGTVTAGSYHVGGLVGMTYLYKILDCYTTNTVKAYGSVGGLLGTASQYTIISRSYSTGIVIPSVSHTSSGGLVGVLNGENIVIEDSYYDKETSGKIDTNKGQPRSTMQMKRGTMNSTIEGEAMYTNWNSWSWQNDGAKWIFTPDTEYPILIWTLP